MSNKIRQIIFFLLFSPIFLSAQEAALTSITTADGLSQGMIFDILKDQDRFVWFGTKNGLNRYDGYNFKVFNHDPFDSLTVSGDVITDLFEDSKGRMWVGTESNGLNYFDRKTEIFYPVSSSDSSFSKINIATIEEIEEDEQGNIWVGILDGVFCIENQTQTQQDRPIFDLVWKPFQQIKTNTKNDLKTLLICKNGDIRVRTENDIYQWNESENQFKIHFADNNTKNHTLIQETNEGSSPTFWIATDNHILNKYNSGQIEVIDYKNLTKNHPDIASKNLTKLLYNASTEEFWLGFAFNSMIYAVDANLPADQWMLKPVITLNPNEYTTQFLFENDATTWFGTNGYGVRKMNTQSSAFQHFLPNESVHIIFDLDKKGTFLNYQFKIHNAFAELDSFQLISKKYDLSDEIKKIIATKNGNYYAIIRSFKYPEKNGLLKLSQAFDTENFYPTQDIQARYGLIEEDAAGNLWMPGQEDDYIKFDIKTETYSKFNAYEIVDKLQPINVFTQCLYKDGQGVFWKGVRNGLLKLVIDENGEPTATHFYQSDFKNRQSLSNNSVSSCLDDPTNPDTYLWVGTKGGGLNKLNKKTGEFEHFTTKHGLPDNVIYGILADEQNTLWLSTNRGLSHFDPVKKTFKNYTKADGLQEDEFNTAAYFKNEKTGKLYFGGINGLTAFFPKDLQTNTKKSPIYITNLKIHNEAIEIGENLKERGVNPLKTAIQFTEKIDLDWHQNQITLEFATLDYDVPEKNRYQYRLENVDNDWVQADKNRLASYANLAPGSYTFEVKGTNSSGIWNETPATLQIIIHPPWWNTWWFYSILLGLLFFVVYKIYQFQINRAKLKTKLLFEQKEAERLAELNRIKTNFFSNITHEFRTPLTLILEPLRQLLKQDHTREVTAKLTLAKNNSERLLQLVNQLLDVSKLEAQKMSLNLKKGYIMDVVEPIFKSFLPLAERKNLKLKLDVPNELDAFYFDNNHVEKVVYNLLSNAIKYTNQGSVILKVSKYANLLNNKDDNKPKNLIIKVIDKGIGIPPAALPHVFNRFYQVEDGTNRPQGTGIGLALTKELVELMGGEISVKSTQGKGSTFTVALPMFAMNKESTLPQPPVHKGESDRQVAQNTPELLLNNNSNFHLSTNRSSVENGGVSDQPLVLLIEDNDELRHFIKQSIATNYKVVEAENGAIGIEKAKEIIPDFIISDLMMPEKNGFEVVKTLKNEVRTSHIPIILLTAKTAMANRLEGLREGADDYLTKPFNTEELLIRMANLIEIRRRLQVKFEQPNALKQVLKKTAKEEIDNAVEQADQISAIDANFLNKLTDIIHDNLGNEIFSVEILAEGVSMSRSQLFRKVKAITNQTPNEFIRNYRLDQAMEMLQEGDKKINQVAAAVGFKDEKYFSKRFKMRFELLPSEVF